MDYHNEINGYQIRIFGQANHFPQMGGTILINNRSIVDWIESNYIEQIEGRKILKKVFVDRELKSVFNVVFLAIRDLEENKGDAKSANHTADHFFNQFIKVWGTSFNVFKSIEEIELWNNVLYVVREWEKENRFNIKKGTPYFFNVINYLFAGNFDFAFNYAHKAIEDDKVHGMLQNHNYNYHDSPAFLFASMNIDQRNNYLWGKVRSLVDYLNYIINEYNREFNESLSFEDIKIKFLSQYSTCENEILYFVYLLATRTYEVYNIKELELYDNDFAKMKNLNYIFSFCLLIDKIMEKRIIPNRINESYIRFKSLKLVEKLSNSIFTESNEEKIKEKLCFYSGRFFFKYPWLIKLTLKKMLRRRKRLHIYNSDYTKVMNKKIINTMLIYFLRNQGAHDIKLEYLNTEIFEKILKSLFFQLFIVVQTLF